jgi:hypothetical protein
MDCPEKQALQSRCTAAWESYEAAVKRAGLGAAGSFPVPRSIRDFVEVDLAVDRKTGKLSLSRAYSTAIFLRGEYLRTSRELSRHLSSHRC